MFSWQNIKKSIFENRLKTASECAPILNIVFILFYIFILAHVKSLLNLTIKTSIYSEIMWRERVYNGTLRPKSEETITGEYLSQLLDGLTATIGTNPLTKLSEAHDVNFIATGLYLGDKYAAKDKRFLVRNGITHVVNAAEGFDQHQVNTSQQFYRDAKIKYLGIPGHDRPSWNISVYFDEVANFIDQAVKSGGKVLVHCVVGISRSATLVLAYLMICKGMNAAEALLYAFKRRRVFPNEGFLFHLAQLNSVLRKSTAPTLIRRY